MKKTARIVGILVVAAVFAGLLTAPAAAATVTIVRWDPPGSSDGPLTVVAGGRSSLGRSRSTGEYRYITIRYRDPVTGNSVYRRFRIWVPETPGTGYQPSEPPAQPPAEPPASPTPEPEQPPPSAELTAEEKQMFDLVNRERIAAGLKPLEVDARLVDLARLKSRDMSEKGYFDHYSPTYGSPFDMMKKAGIAYRAAGENLAGAPTVASAHSGLMNSPGHRANILNPTFTHVGIGVARSNRYGLLFTQMFIARP